MDEKTILYILGIFACFLVIAVILRYKTEGEAEFSIRNWLKFRFKGSNQAEEQETIQEKGIHMGNGGQIRAQEVIGGDKVTIYNQKPDNNIHPKLPQLKIELFQLGRARTYNQEIEIHQDDGMSYRDYSFGVVLINEDTTVAKGIGIKLVFSWKGDYPKRSLKFFPPRRANGWSTSVQQLVNEQSAILNFSEPDLICFSGQPTEWPNFLIRLQERLNGYILLEYTISSFQPQSDNNGELKIHLK